MACEYYSSNNIPLGVGYDTNGNAKSFVELSAITVATVSATTYIGAAVEGTLSSLTDVCYSPTATSQGDILLFDATAACWYSAPNSGGGGSLPNGTAGDILGCTATNSWVARTPAQIAAEPFGLATTAALGVTNANLAATGAALATTNINLAATAAFAVNTFATTGTAQNFTAVKTFTTAPVFRTAKARGILITTGASALDSVSGASGTIPYFQGSLATPAPVMQPIATILTQGADLDDLRDVDIGDAVEGHVLTYNTSNQQWETSAPPNLLFAGSVVESVSGGNYVVSNVVTVPPGTTGKGDSTADSFIFFSGTDASSTEFVGTRWGANWVEGPQNIQTTDGNYFAYVSATTTGDSPGASGVAAVALNANALEFIENGSATTATFAALTVNGTAPSSTIAPTLAGHLTTKTYVDTVDAAIIAGSVLKAIPVTISAKHTATGGISFTTVAPSSTVTPATDNDLTNKAYVDAITGAPKTLLAIGSGTDNVANTEVDLKWKVPEISDAGITISSSSTITFTTAGTYQIDVAARTTGDGRIEGQIRTYLDTDGEGWVEQTSHIATDYTSRDTDQDAGTTNLNTMFALGAGHKLKFTCKTNSDNNATMVQAGTILRIVGWT